eukprot:GILI01015632.1.p1 GENE.GILI01015632.1~~GILI01015632.1.p1  ORF type:complete len:460 (-),score=116.21 GILI01015632.1:80-1459(-)
MADNEDNVPVEEVWEDVVELDDIPDGPTTIFVGGFSKFKSINEALDIVQTSNDRIVVLEQQDGDVPIDVTRYCGVTIVGAIPRNTLEPPKVGAEDEVVDEEEEMDEDELLRRKKAQTKKDTTLANIVVTGRLVLQYSVPSDNNKLKTGFPEVDEDEANDANAKSNGEEDEDGEGGNNNADGEDEDAGTKVVARAPALTLNGLNFTNGLTGEANTNAYIEDCAFGTLAFQPASGPSGDINTKINALSTIEFTRCQLYGSNKAAIYCFPHSRATFIDCDVRGSQRPLTAEEIASRDAKKPRGYVAPPAPAPSAPVDVSCATGIFSDDSSCNFTNVDVLNFGIGIFSVGPNKGFKVDASAVQLSQTVGVLFDQNCGGTIKNTSVKLSGREAGVFGNGHPTVRECTFVGDVRLKRNCVATGITDNIIGLGHNVINEDTQFHLKGFTQVQIDPTAPKKIKSQIA